VATGSPHPNFIGVNHPGRNEHANSVIALDARTGRVIWSFQEIRHDIWDLDLPAPPVLVTVQRNGKRVDAVAQVTKLGNTLLLDRLTGEPLFPFRLRRAPASRLTGEKTWEYQPDIETPQPFARQVFTKDDVTDTSPQARAFVMEQIEKANFGWFEPFEEGRPTVFFGIYGGAEWPGAAYSILTPGACL
jgi:quinoprotein glucose dehydrogenase